MSLTQTTPYLQIRATKGWANLRLREVWQYRELLYFLCWRDIIIRYKQTVVGAGWAIIQPVLSMIVFTLVFGGLAQIPSDGVPYPLFSFAALVPWGFFSGAFTRASSSLVSSANLISKIYFPRLIIPTSAVMAGIVDYLISFAVLVVMLWVYVAFGQSAPFIAQFTAPLGISPYDIPQMQAISINWLWLPYLTGLAFVTTLGVSLWFSAIMVRFRDVRFIVPFAVQLWMYMSPVVYPSSLIQNDTLRLIYGLNPMTGVVEGFRWALLGTDTQPSLIIIASSAVALALLVSGAFYFKKQERTFADVI